MANNARKHEIPSGADTNVSRATIFETFGNSIHDLVPVANSTARAQLMTALAGEGEGPAAGNPVAVVREDAPGLHRPEYTYNGSVFLPFSGVLRFASESDADSFGTANGGLLVDGDRCFAAGVQYVWQGTGWKYASFLASGRLNTAISLTANTLVSVIQVSLPAKAPAGKYRVMAAQTTGAGAEGAHYMRVQGGSTELSKYTDDFLSNQPASRDVRFSDEYEMSHTGGATAVTLQTQVNAASPTIRSARLVVEYVGVS